MIQNIEYNNNNIQFIYIYIYIHNPNIFDKCMITYNIDNVGILITIN